MRTHALTADARGQQRVCGENYDIGLLCQRLYHQVGASTSFRLPLLFQLRECNNTAEASWSLHIIDNKTSVQDCLRINKTYSWYNTLACGWKGDLGLVSLLPRIRLRALSRNSPRVRVRVSVSIVLGLATGGKGGNERGQYLDMARLSRHHERQLLQHSKTSQFTVKSSDKCLIYNGAFCMQH